MAYEEMFERLTVGEGGGDNAPNPSPASLISSFIKWKGAYIFGHF